jgi:DNA polymerase
MSYDELIRQLEFFRDIGARSLEVGPITPRSAAPATPRSSRQASSPPPAPPAPPAPPSKPAIVDSPLDATAALAAIREELGDCQRCKLAPKRTNIVFGSGNPNAELVFVGEAPGADEDEQGLPFVGRAGQLLTKIIESIDPAIKRPDVYICNVLKCRPPENRNPEPDEVFACNPFLRKQLAAIRPKIVCCLGTFAAQTVLQTATSIGKLRGRFHDVDGIRVIATFHPAYLLRSPDKKREVWEDMKQIRAELFRLRG